MGSRCRRGTVAGSTALALFTVSLIVAGPAGAQPASDAAETARELFREGVAAARADRWPEAYEAFRGAYDAVQRPAILLNLANAQAHTGRLLEAAESYEQYLRESAGDAGAAANRTAAEQGLGLVRERIPRLLIQTRGAAEGDETRIDGSAVAAAAAEAGVEVDPGWHQITLHRGVDEVARVQTEVSEGERLEVELVAIAPELHEEETPLIVDVEEDEGTVWTSPWLWTGVGVVLAGAVVAIIVLAASGESDPISGNVGPGVVGVR